MSSEICLSLPKSQKAHNQARNWIAEIFFSEADYTRRSLFHPSQYPAEYYRADCCIRGVCLVVERVGNVEEIAFLLCI